ncbi:hypothetical protein ACJIZ3_002078 [Penstemon smallii]|uniref:Pentatricopeptide repeat-containing protein n=1 Tax=Penstemon smallii TaxID=265156 RepID=A0ABD3U8C9_9LAMI
MEASLNLPNPPPQPNLDHIKRKLIQHNINPTPKILHNIRKKEIQKSNRRLAKQTPPPLNNTQISEESYFQTIKSEYNQFTNKKLVGRPWERLERLRLRELASDNDEYGGDKLNPQHLRELSDIIECDRDNFSWLLDNDVEFEVEEEEEDGKKWAPRKRGEAEAIKFLTDRLSATELSVKDWKFNRMMRYSGLEFTEGQMLKIVAGLGSRGKWRHAMSVVEWVYNSKEHKHYKSRFVYTKLLTVLGRARKPREALRVFNLMRGDAYIYPDMAAFHSMAVTLGQSGCLKELINVIESMKEKPKKIKNLRSKNWDPVLQPDIVIFNAVINACVPTRQWKGVSWVFQQLRKNGLRPNGASYGLAMEVMLQSGKYNLVHELFNKMKRSGEALKALTYKVLVKAFWQEGKVNEAVQAVRDMERRGIVGTASVYYELARCLCFYGRWQEAIMEIKKLKKLRPTRPLAVTFTGMILSSMDGGHVQDCLSIFEHSKTLVSPDIGITNAMIKVYGRNDMFSKAKELFEEAKVKNLVSETSINDQYSLKPDAYTFGSMLEASASALQWEYFEYVYKEMVLCGYQLDQKKHSVLLVEASRAGKWHLLQHAIDTILEAGEIPPVSFFTEMVCQATAHCDYEKAVSIINTMAHASFQVSFQEWIDLFEMNGDRIFQGNLIELQKTLVNHDLVNEPTVLNLSRALQFMCGSFENSLNSTASENIIGSNLGGNLKILESDSIYRVNDESVDSDLEKVPSLSNGSHDGDAMALVTQSVKHFDYDLASNILESDSDDQEFEFIEHLGRHSDSEEFNFEVMMPSSEIDDDSYGYGIPSALEILETWKQMR